VSQCVIGVWGYNQQNRALCGNRLVNAPGEGILGYGKGNTERGYREGIRG